MNKKLIAEMAFIKHLLTDVYPNNNFSYVSDSYDYWAVVSEIMSKPYIKETVLNHNGFIGIRGDSGDPVDIICGTCRDFGRGETPEEKGTVEILWDIYGGSVNNKGYKVLDKHIKAVYGDSITPSRAEEIYDRLARKGFASNNVALGMGSYSLQSCEGYPMTRDTYSIAVKSTYGEMEGEGFEIFKDPKTDTGKFKKSQKGCCVVYKQVNGDIWYYDRVSYKDTKVQNNIIQPIFKDGEIVKDFSLFEIRNNLYKDNF